MREPDSVLNASLRYIERGWWIFPAFVVWNEETRKKEPTFPPSWSAASTNDPAMAAAWFGPGGLYSRGNGVLCIDTGRSGLVVIDPDREGMAGWAAFRERHKVPATYRVATPGGGEHWFYAARPGENVTIDSSGKVAPHVDVRGMGGLVFAAPSVIEGYGAYRWLEGEPEGGSGDCPFVPRAIIEAMNGGAPAAFTGMALAGPRAPGPVAGLGKVAREFTREQAWEFCRARAEEFGALAPGVEGLGRNQRLFELALMMAHFVGVFWDEASTRGVLIELATRNGMVASHGERAVTATINSAWARPRDWVAVARVEGEVTGGEVAPPSPAGDPSSSAEPVTRRHEPLDWEAEFSRDWEAVDWLPGRLAERGQQVSVVGDGKSGKSLVFQEWAWRAVSGRAFLGDEPRPPVRVMYADRENNRRDVISRMVTYGAGAADLAGLSYYSFPTFAPLDTDTGAAEFLAEVDHAAPDVIVLDTASRYVEGKENDSDTWLALYRRLHQSLKARGIACFRLDHFGKDRERGARGSGAKTQDVDHVWELTVTGETVSGTAVRTAISLRRTHTRTGIGTDALDVVRMAERDGGPDGLWLAGKTAHVLASEAPALLAPGAVPGMARPGGADLEWDDRADAAARLLGVIRDVFAEHNGGTKAEIKSVAGMPRATFYRAWNRLCTEKAIGAITGGYYRFVPIEERGSMTRRTRSDDGSYYVDSPGLP